MTQEPPTTCYRHPDRETGRRCTRCGRPACPECLREASVGSHCVDCVKAAAPTTRQRVGMLHAQREHARDEDHHRRHRRRVRRDRRCSDCELRRHRAHRRQPRALRAARAPRRVVADLHGRRSCTTGFLHIFFNMLLLWIIGQILEPGAGPLRFAPALRRVGRGRIRGRARSRQPHAVSAGASGGVFGVAAAATIVMHRQGVRFWDTGFGPLLVINLVLDYFTPRTISIAAHIGGAIGGLLAAEAMLQSRKAGQPELGIVGAVVVGVAAVVLSLAVAETVLSRAASLRRTAGELVRGTSSTAPVSSSSTSRKPHCSREHGAAFPRAGREDLVAGRERDAAGPVEVAALALDREQMEAGVVADLRARDDRAVERAARARSGTARTPRRPRPARPRGRDASPLPARRATRAAARRRRPPPTPRRGAAGRAAPTGRRSPRRPAAPRARAARASRRAGPRAGSPATRGPGR